MAQPQYGGGILRVASASSVAEAARISAKENLPSKKSPELSGLYAYLWNIWEQNRKHKEGSGGIQEQMLKNLRARNNQYDPDKLAEIKAAGMPEIYMGLTNVKCSHAEAWLLDIYSSTASERTWGLLPSPVPDIVDTVAEKIQANLMERMQGHLQDVQSGASEPITAEQYAQIAAEEMENVSKDFDEEVLSRTKDMEKKIFDQLVEGGWMKAFEETICDIVTLKAGIVKGPIVRKHKKPLYQGNGTGVTFEITDRPEYWRVSPLDIYPSPTAENIDDGSLVERTTFSRKELLALRNEPGYNAAAINRVLENFSSNLGNVESTSDSDREEVEDKDSDADDSAFREDIDGLEFWCPVQGRKLIEYGVDKVPGLAVDKVGPLDEFEVNAIVVGKEVIYVALNDDPIGNRPYSKTGWRKVPGSFWYKGVPELMDDLQRVVNASIRSLCYNMSMASGPQVELDVNRLVPGENITSAFPGKVWQVINPGNLASQAVRFFQPESNASELISIYDRFASLADDYTGIPAYAYGNDRVAGAGRTSSGLSMLMGAAAKGIKRVILAIDMDIFKTVVRRQFDWNMQYIPDPNIKGDVEIVTTGAVAIMVKEQMSERRMQFLSLTNNDLDMKIVGVEGRANLLREAASSLELSSAKIVKTPEEIKKMSETEEANAASAAQTQQQLEQAQMQLQLQGMQLSNQVKELQLQIEQQKMVLEMEKAKLQAGVEQGKLLLDKTRLDLEAVKVQIAAETARAQSMNDAKKTELAKQGIMLSALEKDASNNQKKAELQLKALTGKATIDATNKKIDTDAESKGIEQLLKLTEMKENKDTEEGEIPPEPPAEESTEDEELE